MLTELFPSANSTPAVRRPVIEVGFGGGSPEDWAAALVALKAEAGLAPSVDVVEIVLASNEQTPSVAVGDEGSVSLGYEDSSSELVFTGRVESVEYGLEGVMLVTATNGGAPLSRLRVNRSYEQQNAGDIVGDLAGSAETETDVVESGVEFPFYVVDDRRSAYQHIHALGKKSGYVVYFTTEGKLNFTPYTGGQAVQTFTYAQDILSVRVIDQSPMVGAVTTVGEGAAGGQGQEAWSWLVKDPSSVQGSSGEGAPERLIQDGSLRSTDAAQSAADGVAGAGGLLRTIGRLLAPGAPTVTVGSTIEIAGAPQESINGACMVRAVHHRFSKQEGFTTLIVFSKTNGGALVGLGGLGL